MAQYSYTQVIQERVLDEHPDPNALLATYTAHVRQQAEKGGKVIIAGPIVHRQQHPWIDPISGEEYPRRAVLRWDLDDEK